MSAKPSEFAVAVRLVGEESPSLKTPTDGRIDSASLVKSALANSSLLGGQLLKHPDFTHRPLNERLTPVTDRHVAHLTCLRRDFGD